MSPKVYLDNCCFNRPFDDQNQIRIRLETEAKLFLQQKIEEGELLLAWSYILDYENAANPFEIRRISIKRWQKKAFISITGNDEITNHASQLAKHGLKAKDALHIASAIFANCEYFITTDDQILSKNKLIEELSILSPVDMTKVIEDQL